MTTLGPFFVKTTFNHVFIFHFVKLLLILDVCCIGQFGWFGSIRLPLSQTEPFSARITMWKAEPHAVCSSVLKRSPIISSLLGHTAHGTINPPTETGRSFCNCIICEISSTVEARAQIPTVKPLGFNTTVHFVLERPAVMRCLLPLLGLLDLCSYANRVPSQNWLRPPAPVLAGGIHKWSRSMFK